MVHTYTLLGPFLPLHMSLHRLITPAIIFHSSSHRGARTWRKLKIFVALSLSPVGGRMSIKSCMMGCTRTHTHTQKTYCTQDKTHTLSCRLYIYSWWLKAKQRHSMFINLGSLCAVCADDDLSGIDGGSDIMKTNIDVLFVLMCVLVAEPVTGKASSWQVHLPPCHGRTPHCLDTSVSV